MKRVDEPSVPRVEPDLSARTAALAQNFSCFAGGIHDRVAADAPRAARVMDGLWRRDPTAWSADPAVRQKIANRLGWLASPELMAGSVDRLTKFADGIKAGGFTDAVLLGMGGSSLAPEVLRAILGSAAGFPTLHVLDSTDPAAVRAAATPPARTLYLLASKSGSTIEPNSLAAHFQQRLRDAGISSWADHFVAITDEGTELAVRARGEHFRELFINPGDIGGRYSALSFFGLVPAALMGQDIGSIIAWGLAMLSASREPEVMRNPAALLGLLMGSAARAGRDKLTLLLPADLEPFGLWVEQLVAESTGKNGVGILPVAGERTDPSRIDRPDRLFSALAHQAEGGAAAAPPKVESPVFAAMLPERTALGAEFVRWEIATAVAGALLEINPFDEPNVQQAKDATRRLLDQYTGEGRLPVAPPNRTTRDGVSLTLSSRARDLAHPEHVLGLLHPGDYFALLAYLGPDPALLGVLQEFRLAVLARTGVATTLGYGPRYLHSTGQLHKGGANTGVFLIVTAEVAEDLPIPGQPFSFGTLELAQALGDFGALDATGRRALHLHLPAPDPAVLRRALDRCLEPSTPARG
jgi:glucose-6-phosphate isomerase